MKLEYFDPASVQHDIAQIITQHFTNPLDKTRFIFATNIDVSSWIDWTIDHVSSAVPLERFWAWDSFKSQFFNIAEQQKRSIPALMRKFFARDLLMHSPFKALIPQKVSQSPQEAIAFTDWIASLLPSLQLWYDKFTTYKTAHPEYVVDALDEDYETLYTLYKDFLEAKNRQGPVFFEPAWIDASKIQSSVDALQDEYILFYPEILEDWEEYRPYFTQSRQIQIVSLPDETVMSDTMHHPTATFYPNARSELRALALQIRSLCAPQSGTPVPWDRVAITVPDIATWRPYIERELSLYCIPAVIRVGESLTKGAGRLFRQLQTCYEHSFDYDSLRSLLLDASIPWKDEKRNQLLIQAGYDSRCLCNDLDLGGRDVWELSLDSNNTGNTSELEIRYYKNLKHCITKLCTAPSFEEIYRQWFIFKNEFINADSFTKHADMLISRCIAQLTALKDLEQEFFEQLGLHCPAPYSFFLQEIENTVYQPQTHHGGVSVFDYRVAACSAYPYQFVLNATQSACTVQSQQLSFLNTTKRRELGIVESSAPSDAFIRLYGANPSTVISCSENTFSGFAIPYNQLSVSDKPIALSVPQNDFIKQLPTYLQSGQVGVVSNQQYTAFTQWRQAQLKSDDTYTGFSSAGKTKVDKTTHRIARWQDDTYKNIGLVSVSQSDLKNYVSCPRHWLYARVLNISEESFDTNLLGSFDLGTLNHKILELFMTYCKTDHKGQLPTTRNDVLQYTKPDDEQAIRRVIQTATTQAIDDAKMNFAQSPLVKQMLHNQEAIIVSTILQFLRALCATDAFGGTFVIGIELPLATIVKDEEETPQFVYHGFIDLLLSDEKDNDTVVDYKNTYTAIPAANTCTAQNCTDLTNFQMLVYAKLWAGSGEHRSINKAVFYAIQTGDKRYIRNPDDTRYKNTTAQFDNNLDALDAEVTLPFVQAVQAYNFIPDKNKVVPYRDCISCAYKAMCRTTFTVSGDPL